MKLQRAKSNCGGLTLVEVLVVVVVFIFMVNFLMPESFAKNRALAGACKSNQKQIGLGFILWQGDNADKFPWQVSETNQGAMEASSRGEVAADYNLLQSYIRQPRMFICPSDPIRLTGTIHASLENQNLSYFVGIDGTTNYSVCILTGDRHLQTNGDPVRPGLFNYTTNADMNWTSELHRQAAPLGVLSFYDGHVEQIRGIDLNATFQRADLAPARLAVP